MKFIRIISFFFFVFCMENRAGAQVEKQIGTVDFGHNKEAGRHVDIRGFNMYYESYGKGDPLLLIHGNGGSIGDFKLQIPFFARQYRVIVADCRAQGQSADPSDSLSYSMIMDDLNALLDSLHITSCNVVGWSDGGIEALLLAIHHPEKVKKMVITGANVVADTTAVDPFSYRFFTELYDSLKRKPSVPETKNELKILKMLSSIPLTPQDLSQIRCPTLVVAGDHDVIRPHHTLLIFQSIPDSYLWIIPGSGHAVPVNFKDMFNTTVNSFFNTPFRKIEGFDKFN